MGYSSSLPRKCVNIPLPYQHQACAGHVTTQINKGVKPTGPVCVIPLTQNLQKKGAKVKDLSDVPLKWSDLPVQALSFGLAMAPQEFAKVVKEVEVMAQARGIRIHQYLDDWLLRAPCQETCLQHTQTLLALCKNLDRVVNLNKSELIHQQVWSNPLKREVASPD